MTMVTQTDLQQGFEKMKQLPLEEQLLILSIIDKFSDPAPSAPFKKLGIADGKYHIPDDINLYDDQISQMFGVIS